MQTLEASKYKFYVPWEIAALLKLLGFDEYCMRQFSYYSHHKLLEQTKYLYKQNEHHTYYNGKYHSKPSQAVVDEIWKRYTDGGLEGAFKHAYTYVPCPTYEQVKEWLRVNYDVDFNEYPRGGMGKLYYCEPIVSGRCLNVEPGKTPKEAQLNAFNLILPTLKPLPGEIEEVEQSPHDEELEEISKHLDKPMCISDFHKYGY